MEGVYIYISININVRGMSMRALSSLKRHVVLRAKWILIWLGEGEGARGGDWVGKKDKSE